ncbi:hypothetical protein ACRRVD_00085 [Candidatus Cardinium hertigii]|uniref:hypothetical protein n=1 Tax=Candidatus Cardinium hertigii TaxID=247481 RepID=UPI003D7CDED2
MSTSTSKLIFLLFLPILTAEKCAGSKNGNLKRDAPTIAASKMAAVADEIDSTDLSISAEQLDIQQKEKEKENKKDQVRTEVKTVVPDVEKAKNTELSQKNQSWETEPPKKNQSWEGENVFEKDKQSTGSAEQEAGSEPRNDDIASPDNKTDKQNKNILRKQWEKIWGHLTK